MPTLSYAFYRLPYADSYTLITSEQPPQEVDRLDTLGDLPGFVLFPFHQSAESPALLILPDSIENYKFEPAGRNTLTSEMPEPADLKQQPDSSYATAFDAFHGAVEKGAFRKLVLARSKTLALANEMDVNDPQAMRVLFEKACRLYPRLMVMLYTTPKSGTWLVASPEILVDGKNRSMHTVALAGTMPFQEGHVDWSEKNKQEQHIVEQYIEQIVTRMSTDVLKDGPVTMRAGNLVHLRTDFRFHLAQNMSLGTLVHQLHPTPAVCGMPKQDAAGFIAAHEGMDRRYYSGFAGPVDIQGETHLYVALRCAELHGTTATLYAGGGIMQESDCLSEWQETESKMKTIQHVLQ